MVRSKPFHFILIGALLFLMQGWLPAPQVSILPPDEARIESIKNQWLQTNGRLPTGLELGRLVQRELDNDILFQEALIRQWHETDSVVQQRLISNMKLLSQNASRDEGENNYALFKEALRLQMHHSDPVVRRRLIQLVEFDLQKDVNQPGLNEKELRAYFEASAKQFTLPARSRVSHVFLSSSRVAESKESLLRRARAVQQELNTKKIQPEKSSYYTDPFISGHHFNWMTDAQLASIFGDSVALKLLNLVPGNWSDPIESVFGIHLFWVHERQEPRIEDPNDPLVREKIRSGIFQQRAMKLLAENMIALREKYSLPAFYDFQVPDKRKGKEDAE